MSTPAQEVVTSTDMATPLNTDLSDTQETALTGMQSANLQVPQGVSPLVMMLGSGQLQPEHLEKAMELQEKHDSYEAKKAFSVAMARFRSLAPVLQKDKTVSFKTSKGSTQYDHTSLGHMMTVVNPILGECELNLSWHPRQDGNMIFVKTRLTHVLGHSESVELHGPSDSSGTKNAIQSMKSTVTYLKRAGADSLLGLASSDDNDGRTAEPPPAPLGDKVMSQIIDLLDGLSKSGRTKARDYYLGLYGEAETHLGINVPMKESGKVIAELKRKLNQEKKKADKGDAK